MRVITLNVNGLRSASAKGFMPWMRRQRADVVCLQEIKCQVADLTRALLAPRGYHAFFHPAEKRGYSGVGIYSKREPDKVVLGLGIAEFDAQGRYIQADFGSLSVVSIYFPSGSASAEAQARKLRFLAAFMPRLEAMLGTHYDRTPAPARTVTLDQPTFSHIGLHSGVRWTQGRYRLAATYIHYWYDIPQIEDSITSPPSNIQGDGHNDIFSLAFEATIR